MDRVDGSLYWVALRDYLPGCELKAHVHAPEEYHYIYVLKGSGRIRIGNEAFALTPGVIYLTAPGISHTFSSSQEEMLLTVELKFVLPDRKIYEKALGLPLMIEDTDGALGQLLDRIRRESEAERPYRREILEIWLQELLLLLLRAARGEEPSERNAAEASMQPVLRYIRENLHRSISLEDLAAAAHLEKAYFSRKFKSVAGYSPMEYVRRTRLEKAKDLLRYSDMTVTQVSEALGFQSLHHFSKAFRKYAGVSPRAYQCGQRLAESKPRATSSPEKATQDKDTPTES